MGQVGRRRFLTVIGAGALASPLACLARVPDKVARIGILSQDSERSDFAKSRRRQFQEALRRGGYEAGRNIVVEWRFAEGRRERLPELSQELVRLDVDVIVAFASEDAAHAAAQATRTIPIVLYSFYGDPVKQGLVASFGRPGGNVTGTTWIPRVSDLVVKQYEMLRSALPEAVRVAVLFPPYAPNWEQIQADINGRANKAFGFVPTDFLVRKTDEIPSTLERIGVFRPDALYVGVHPIIRPRLREVTAFAKRERLAATGSAPPIAYEGGLFYYGPSHLHVMERVVSFIDRILHGADPANLAVEQPQRYDLILNSRTALAIGFSALPMFQARVTEVVG